MGKRSSDWIKCKRMADEEFIVAGYLQKGKHIFSLIIAKYMESFLIYKGHVTAGVTRDIIEELTITNRSPFHILPVRHFSVGAVFYCLVDGHMLYCSGKFILT